MADIRCTKCQTLNPADAKVCKNCGQPLQDESTSWLDSLRSGTDSPAWEEPETQSNSAEEIQPEEIPDWLQRIRQRNIQDQPPENSESSKESSEDLPEWLREIQQPSSDQPTGSDSGSDADWLQSLRSSEPAAPGSDSLPGKTELASHPPFESDLSDEAGADTPDWMKNLETWKAEKDQKSGQAEESPAMDWDGGENGATSPAQPPASAGEDDQDWLNRLSQTGGSQPPASDSSDADWLAGLQAGSEPAPEKSTPPKEPGAEPSDADWLSGLQTFSGTPAAESTADESPVSPTSASDEDWLAGLQVASGSAAEPSPAEEQPAATGADFDWMSRLGGETQPEQDSALGSEPAAGFSWESEAPSQQNSAGSQPETPDWLREFGTHQPENTPAAGNADQFEASLPEEGEAAQPSGELPDWLSKFSAQEPEAQPASDSTDKSESAGPEKVPAWLSDFPTPESEAPTAETQPASEPMDESKPTGPENVPAWLSNFPVQGPEESVGESMPTPGIPGETKPAAPESVPDWLTQFAPSEPPAQPAEPVAPISEEPQSEGFTWQSLGLPAESGIDQPEKDSAGLPFSGANLPEWLDQAGEGEPRLPLDEELIPPAKPAGEPEPSTPFAQAEIPDWLGESGPADHPAQAAGDLPAEGSDQPLEAAELPSWLQSMRPIETVAPKPISAEEKRVEKAGPLAGITGVLPTEDLVGQYIKPPLYTVKLRVSEKQRVHASLIENLIGEETQPQAIPPERSEAPKRLLRFLVAVALILAILLPMLNILPAFPASDMLPQELVAFEQVMSDETVLPQGSAVLLALEYEPGLSGEMQTASEAVVRQLAERNVTLTVISTSPTGPILAESLLEKAGFDPSKVVNLGYLAGGSTGLQSFSLSPAQSAPATLQGQLAPWNSGILTGVSKLSDFAATIVLTDDPDRGRTWIEQVQPALAGKPMLMVSSAQAAPLLQPYYNSGQVKGILSGINGAAGYEDLAQSSGTATLLRGSYQYGMLLAALLILVGGLISAIAASITRGKAEKEA